MLQPLRMLQPYFRKKLCEYRLSERAKFCAECFQKKISFAYKGRIFSQFQLNIIIKFMSTNQQFGQKNYKTRFHQSFRSKLIENLFSFFEYCDIKTMKPKYAKKLTNISGGIFSLFNILLDLFIGLCPIIQQKRRSPDATMYSRRITNNIFYRSVKIIMCI